MADTLSASKQGLAIANQARQRRGWTKTSTARWWQEAHTSRATLRRFWRGENIQKESFIAICNAVGITNWQQVSEAGVSSPVTTAKLAIADWDEAPDLSLFCGRSPELKQLTGLVLRDRCRFISITGLPGIGKTALTLAFADRVQTQFEGVIWRSLLYYPSPSDLVESLLAALETPVPAFPKRVPQLVRLLKQRRYLIVLDGLDNLLQNDMSDDSLSLQTLLNPLIGMSHQSCILVTSRPPLPLDTATASNFVTLQLNGLNRHDALQLLNGWEIAGNEPEKIALVRRYGSNPLAMQLAVPVIQSMFGGDVKAFLRQNELFVGDRLRTLLRQLLGQLTPLERDILYWLAIWKEPIALSRLQTHLMPTPNPMQVIEGLMQLEGRSLVSKSFVENEPMFSLPPLILEQGTEALVDQAVQDLLRLLQGNVSDQEKLTLWHTHALVRPGTDDVDGDRILIAIATELKNCGGRTFLKRLIQLQVAYHDRPPQATGYLPHNISALLRKLNVHFQD